eukprot:scaffold1272_cov250-Pinguiococcus_pyrenoidosus.AAC.45
MPGEQCGGCRPAMTGRIPVEWLGNDEEEQRSTLDAVAALNRRKGLSAVSSDAPQGSQPLITRPVRSDDRLRAARVPRSAPGGRADARARCRFDPGQRGCEGHDVSQRSVRRGQGGGHAAGDAAQGDGGHQDPVREAVLLGPAVLAGGLHRHGVLRVQVSEGRGRAAGGVAAAEGEEGDGAYIADLE